MLVCKNQTNLNKKPRNLAFTLAEVLITLGVIGIVAAITIPALINRTNDKELQAQWKKTYSAFSQAQEQIIANEGDFNDYNAGYNYDDFSKLTKYMSFSKVCAKSSTPSTAGCWYATSEAKSPACAPYPAGGVVQYIADNGSWTTGSGILQDGTTVIWYMTLWIAFDVNGQNPPNVNGRDIFTIHYDSTKKRYAPRATSGCYPDSMTPLLN